ncbi:enoyl-CoA hydratase/isomerase family protein, partial [Rhodococcus oxybenzonivorans]
MVDLELEQELAVITIDRPHARNAIAPETMDQLEKALDAAAGAKALVIRGAGDRAFVSGGDLKELSKLRTEEQAADMARRMRTVCDQIADFPAPVVAALNGHALGGGAEVAVAADIRVAADDIKIGFNQVALAIMPAWGGAERLAALVGPGKALMLAGSGAVLDAAEAERLGLVDLV